ncbi:hypothetical protein PAMP_003996 [Pampus punctatissimus]
MSAKNTPKCKIIFFCSVKTNQKQRMLLSVCLNCSFLIKLKLHIVNYCIQLPVSNSLFYNIYNSATPKVEMLFIICC